MRERQPGTESGHSPPPAAAHLCHATGTRRLGAAGQPLSRSLLALPRLPSPRAPGSALQPPPQEPRPAPPAEGGGRAPPPPRPLAAAAQREGPGGAPGRGRAAVRTGVGCRGPVPGDGGASGCEGAPRKKGEQPAGVLGAGRTAVSRLGSRRYRGDGQQVPTDLGEVGTGTALGRETRQL